MHSFRFYVRQELWLCGCKDLSRYQLPFPKVLKQKLGRLGHLEEIAPPAAILNDHIDRTRTQYFVVSSSIPTGYPGIVTGITIREGER